VGAIPTPDNQEKLASSILIARPPERVWSFLGDVSNIPRWDRGVAGVRHGSAGVTGVGSEFETVADVDQPPDARRDGRMSYRIAEEGQAAAKTLSGEPVSSARDRGRRVGLASGPQAAFG
jgi:hypothetical protein